MNRITRLALATVCAAALAGCGGPAASPSPSATLAPTPSGSPSPSATATAEPEPFTGLRDDEIDDATILSRYASPRTGEAWHAPTPTSGIHLLDPAYGAVSYFEVGTHDDATLVIAVSDRTEFSGYAPIEGLFEIGGGAYRFVSCPSARTGDPCIPVPEDLAPGVAVDTGTFYDTLTYPHSLPAFPGFAVGTEATISGFEPWQSPLGDGNWILPGVGEDENVYAGYAAGTITPLASFGDVDLVQVAWPSAALPGYADLTYALRAPYGGIVDLAGADLPAGSYDAIDWDDGVTRTASLPYDEGNDDVIAPGSGYCFSGQYTIDSTHDAAAWEETGVAPGGISIFTPTSAANATAHTVRATMDDWSYGYDYETGDPIPYPYASDAAFHDARALFAYERPDGVWLLGLRPDATNLVTECV